jgi:hypothetical protein
MSAYVKLTAISPALFDNYNFVEHYILDAFSRQMSSSHNPRLRKNVFELDFRKNFLPTVLYYRRRKSAGSRNKKFSARRSFRSVSVRVVRALLPIKIFAVKLFCKTAHRQNR